MTIIIFSFKNILLIINLIIIEFQHGVKLKITAPDGRSTVLCQT